MTADFHLVSSQILGGGGNDSVVLFGLVDADKININLDSTSNGGGDTPPSSSPQLLR